MTLVFFSMPLTPGSLVACRSTALAMLRCELVVAPDLFSGTSTQGNFRWCPIVRSLLSESRSSPFCLSSALLQGSEAPPRRAFPFRLECRMHCHCHLVTTGQLAFRVFGPRPISPTNSPNVPCACLDRQRRPVTTTASDDDFSMPTNTPTWNRGSHFLPLAGLGGVYRIFSPNSRICVLSFRPCSLCSGAFPSVQMSHLFVKCATNSTSQHSILASGRTLAPNAMFQRSLQCCA